MIEESRILNAEVINELIAIIGDDLTEIYDEFRSSTILNFEDAHKSLTNNEFDQLCTIIHSIKGSSGNIGLELFSNQCHAYESQLRNKEVVNHKQTLTQLETTFNNSINELVIQGLLT